MGGAAAAGRRAPRSGRLPPGQGGGPKPTVELRARCSPMCPAAHASSRRTRARRVPAQLGCSPPCPLSCFRTRARPARRRAREFAAAPALALPGSSPPRYQAARLRARAAFHHACNVPGFFPKLEFVCFYFCIIMTSASSYRIFFGNKNYFY